MRGPDGTGRVVVLDVDYSSRAYHIFLGDRANRHAYYLRPPAGMNANDFKALLDEVGGEEELGFRYWVFPELHTDLKPIITADPFAEKYFQRDNENKFLQIEGERQNAREAISTLLSGLKQPFTPDVFPDLPNFSLVSFKAAGKGGHTEVALLRTDRDRNELRKSEPRFNVGIAECGLAREIDVHRPIVAESEPVLILNSNESTSEFGFKFLNDLAAYFGSTAYESQSRVQEVATQSARADVASRVPTYIPPELRAPRVEPPKIDEGKLLARAASALREQLPNMKLLKKREASQTGPQLTVRFPGALGFGKGPSEADLKEFNSIYRAVRGDPSFGETLFAYYQIDDRTGDLRVLASMASSPPPGWNAF